MTLAGATVGALSESYLANLQEQFGNSLDLSDEFRVEWVSIPHIYHTPFYVYAYTFGQLLVLALYHQYRQEGEAFKPRYLRILEAGGSDSPERILKSAGLDIHDPGILAGRLRRPEGRLEGARVIGRRGVTGEPAPGEPGHLVVLVDRERAIARIRHYGVPGKPDRTATVEPADIVHQVRRPGGLSGRSPGTNSPGCPGDKGISGEVGFEPTVAQRATTVFETAPFNHSGTSPAAIIPSHPSSASRPSVLRLRLPCR